MSSMPCDEGRGVDPPRALTSAWDPRLTCVSHSRAARLIPVRLPMAVGIRLHGRSTQVGQERMPASTDAHRVDRPVTTDC